MNKQPFSFDRYSTPEEAGVSSQGLLRFLKEAKKAEKKVQFHSMILLRHGKEVCRFNWAPYDDHTPHTLFSLSKSFTSAAAGFAVAEGLLRWDSSVTEILPEEVPEGRGEELRAVTVETLLSMGSGLEEASDSPSPDPGITWARHVLSHSLKYPPMTHFHYNTFGTYLVSCMVQKVTGQTLTDYLMPRLFAPLEIEKPVWDLSPQGVCCGGFGLHLRSEAIARFGQCLLQKGVWQGKQVLPEGWVELATREHIANYEGERQDGNEWGQGYGFQFWRCMDGRYRGDGAFGQACIVDEARDAVLAVTCGAADMGEEFRLIREYLFPALDAAPANRAGQSALKRTAAGLAYPKTITGDGEDRELPTGEYWAAFDGVKACLRLEPCVYDLIKMTLRFGEGPHERIAFYLPRCRMGFAGATPDQRYFGAYCWNKGKLRIVLRSPDGPDTMDGTFSWTAKRVTFTGLGIHAPGGKVVFEKE